MAGSSLLALAGPRLAGGGPTGWWWAPRVPAAAFYLGMVAIAAAWLRLGRALGDMRLRDLYAVGVLWSAPLVAGPVLFSHDVYSYLAQGELLHLGANPYRDAPIVLAHLGQPHLLAAVDPFWRRTTAPYGPLFLEAMRLIVAVTGAKLIAGALLARALELAGVVLIAICVPRLAESLGADRLRAAWLAVLSPLVLFQLVAAAHNDALMVGLMVTGVACAVRGRPLPAIALCTLAAMVKLPAGMAVVFIAVAWAREGAVASRLLASALVAGLSALAVGVLAGTGLSWVSGSLISAPHKVRLAITPATGVGWTLHWLGLGDSSRQLESAGAVLAFGAALAVGGYLLWRTRRQTMVRDLGVMLLIAAICGPAAWPWYLAWAVPLLASEPSWQRSWALPVAAVVSALLVKPHGTLALPLPTAPAVVVVYAATAAAVVWVRRRRRVGMVPVLRALQEPS